MDRLITASFYNMDAPLGRFWKTRNKLNDMTVWADLTEDIFDGIMQCSELRERLAAVKVHCVSKESMFSVNHETEIWATAAIWACHGLYTAIAECFGIDEIKAEATSALTGGSHDGWTWRYHEWDIRDSVKIKHMSNYPFVLFSSILQGWKAGILTTGKLIGDQTIIMNRSSISIPCLKRALLGAIEVARYVSILALSVAEFRIPIGLPNDNAGQQIRNCCATLQARRLLQRDPLIIDGLLEGEESYFRSLATLLNIHADTVEIVKPTDEEPRPIATKRLINVCETLPKDFRSFYQSKNWEGSVLPIDRPIRLPLIVNTNKGSNVPVKLRYLDNKPSMKKYLEKLDLIKMTNRKNVREQICL